MRAGGVSACSASRTAPGPPPGRRPGRPRGAHRRSSRRRTGRAARRRTGRPGRCRRGPPDRCRTGRRPGCRRTAGRHPAGRRTDRAAGRRTDRPAGRRRTGRPECRTGRRRRTDRRTGRPGPRRRTVRRPDPRRTGPGRRTGRRTDRAARCRTGRPAACRTGRRTRRPGRRAAACRTDRRTGRRPAGRPARRRTGRAVRCRTGRPGRRTHPAGRWCRTGCRSRRRTGPPGRRCTGRRPGPRSRRPLRRGGPPRGRRPRALVVAPLRGFLLRPAAGPQELDRDRHHRDQHDQDEDHLDVLVHEVDLAEGRTEQRHPDAPEHAPDDVERDERAVVHPAHTGDDRREGPHDGHEAGQHQRLRAVLLEELVGLLDVLLLEEAGVRALEERGSHLPAEEIADLVTDDRRQGDQDADQPQRVLQVARRHQQTRGEQQGVAGQEEADQQPGLGEHDEQEAGQPEGVEQIIRVQPARAERKRIQGSGLQGWSVCAAAWPPQAINAAADAWVPLA